MKKVLLLLAVLLCMMAVSAKGNAITCNFAQWGFEYKTSSYHSNSLVKSDYGFGVDLGYQRVLAKGFYGEAGIGCNRMDLGPFTPKEWDIIVYAGAGYRVNVAPWLSLFVHADLGEDTTLYGKYAQATFAVKTGAGISLEMSDVRFNICCDGNFSFCHDSKARYVDYRILPMFGISCGF